MTIERKPILRPCTIIPNELYVERAADRQLVRILGDMGRPGYVLVARQMGKTNLLLHARSAMAGGSDAFVYVDVSNTIPDLRTFFRSIIDTCIESQPDKFLNAMEAITEQRNSNSHLLEHKEHEIELRHLLRASAGCLVICIDEIDALTKTDYSDQVFSLIRSIYFSGRTNFEEFHRLTYVLSGVAEPTEIIKNRSISPFNIGEKIYLEDFSFDEFSVFLEKSQLNLSKEVGRHIYSWTGGNPRICWDVCAAIESLEEQVTIDAIDKIVDKLYLRDFDLPPVDHIRTLVKTDKEVRSAIMEIHYGKSESVTHSVRSRLYLSGIIAASSSSPDLKIKNKIIEAALSEKWLEEVERSEQSTLEYADQLFRDQRYPEALAAYENCGEDLIKDVDFFTLRKGSCQYFIGKYEDAIITLTSQPYPKSRSVDLYVMSRSRIANAQLLLGKFEESISAFEKLISEFGANDEDQPLSFYQAKLNLSSAYLAITPAKTDRVIELCESVISSIFRDPVENNSAIEILEQYTCLAHYNICVASLKVQLREKAQHAMDEAILHAGRSNRATLMLERLQLFRSGSFRVHESIACADSCISTRVAITGSPRAERPLAFSVDRAASLVLELKLGGAPSAAALKRFLQFCFDKEVGHEVSVHQIIIMAASYAFHQKRSEAAIQLYSDGAKLQDYTDNKDYWALLAFNLAVCPLEEVMDYSNEFTAHMLKSSEPPRGVGIRATHRVLQALISDGQFKKADAILSASGFDDFTVPTESVSIDEFVYLYLRLVADIALEKPININESAIALYKSLSYYSGARSELYAAEYRSHLLRQIMALSPDAFSPKTIHRSSPKFGRNNIIIIRHEDGRVEQGKYKRFEILLREGKATLVSEN